MLWESFRPEHSQEIDITKGLLLITLSVATSIDALAIGLSFAFLKVNISVASVTIGAVAFLVTMIGFVAGKRVNKVIGKRAETLEKQGVSIIKDHGVTLDAYDSIDEFIKKNT